MRYGLKWRRDTLTADLGAGLTVALVGIPEGMAYAMVAGVSPIYGLYTGMVTTIVASFTASTSRMIVSLTNALALVVGEQLAALQPEDPIRAMYTLTFLVGLIMLGLGLLRMGSAIRFVSREVMSGFVFATALLLVLGQLDEFVGYSSEFETNKVFQAIDILRNVGQWNVQALLVGAGSIALLIWLKRRPRVRKYADAMVILISTLAVLVLGLGSVELVGAIAEIPGGWGALPLPVLPDLTLLPSLMDAALAATVVGLAQSSGVGTAYPNLDGSRSRLSRDFSSQGLANIAGSFFQAMPAGGSLSRTGVNVSGGAQTRWAGIYAGVTLAVVLVLFGSAAELIPLSVLSAVLIFIGAEIMIREARELREAWDVSRVNAGVAIVTILVGAFAGLTVAIFTGVVLSLLVFLDTAANDVEIIELYQEDDGEWAERAPPATLERGEVHVLEIRGAVYFASIYFLDNLFPPPAAGSTVILRLRGRVSHSLTSMEWLAKYARTLAGTGGRLILADLDPRQLAKFEAAGLGDSIGRHNMFLAGPKLFEGTEAAMAAVSNDRADSEPSRSPQT